MSTIHFRQSTADYGYIFYLLFFIALITFSDLSFNLLTKGQGLETAAISGQLSSNLHRAILKVLNFIFNKLPPPFCPVDTLALS
jgi:hypothetical protein